MADMIVFDYSDEMKNRMTLLYKQYGSWHNVAKAQREKQEKSKTATDDKTRN